MSAAGISREDARALILHFVDQGEGRRCVFWEEVNKHNPGDLDANFNAIQYALNDLSNRGVIRFHRPPGIWRRGKA